jgi:CRP-like cAMP-binding protein
MHGHGSGDVHEEIFHQPTDLQLALLVPPEERKTREINVIADALTATDLFLNVEDEGLIRHVAANVEYRSVLKNDFVFQQGEPVDCVCILLSGSIAIKAEATDGVVFNVGEVCENQYFGDQWILMNEHGTSRDSVTHQSYIARAACQLLVVEEHAAQFEGRHILDICKERIDTKAAKLQRTKLFDQWSAQELFDVACLSFEKNFPKGKELVSQGKGYDYLGVLTKGLCGVTK